MTSAYVGLGSNVGDRERTLRAAVTRLRHLPKTQLVAVSELRNTEPVGYVEQPCFLNGAVALETSLSARRLLEELLRLEQEFGRDRTGVPAQGPRTLDLDLVQYGDPVFDTDVVMDTATLTLPHPRAHERAFVLVPWLQAEPEAALRVDGTVRRVADLVAGLDTSGVRPGPDVDLLEGPW